MRAEAACMRGRFTDAHIELERAYAQIQGNGQENMALCCDFLARRLSLHTDVKPRCTFAQRYEDLLRHHNLAWLNIWNATSAYYHALLGQTEHIPELFGEHRLSTVSILAPGKPMMEMIENQVYLAQGAYARVIGRSAPQLAVCEAMHYALPAMHVRIQTAAAYAMLGREEDARALLSRALADARPDGFALPFVENHRYLKTLLPQLPQTDLTREILRLGEAARSRGSRRPEALAALTEREQQLAELMAARLTNREIAERLFLSEGSVKQYINRIYAKLGIAGDTRTKRKRLAELFSSKT